MIYQEIEGKSLDLPQRDFLKYLAELAQSRFEYPVIINIGVLMGCSLACLRAGSPDGVIIGVDIDFEHRFPRIEYHAYLKAIFIECDSHYFARMLHNPAHLVFVDGGHSYRAALGDLRLWSEKVPTGGIVAVHDLHMPQVRRAFTAWYDPEVWQEIEGSPYEEFRAYERRRLDEGLDAAHPGEPEKTRERD